MPKDESLNKIKLFTHTDLDGIGNYILAKTFFNDVDVDFCNYDDVNTKLSKLIEDKEFKEFDHIFITDISVNESIAQLVEKTVFIKKNSSYKLKNYVTLLDHHKTAEFLNKYSWCQVVIKDDKGICSGTSLFYNYLKTIIPTEKDNKSIEDFVELVRRYDTWEWFNIYNDAKASKLNSLLFLYGRERFINKILDKIKNNSFEFDDTDTILLELDEENKNRYMGRRLDAIVELDIAGHKAGIVQAEQYISELGNHLAQERQDLDFIAIINDGKVSYRGIKQEVDLSAIAAKFGGGGHKLASGSTIPKEKLIKFFEDVFRL